LQKAEAIQGKVFSVQDMGFQKAIRGLKMFFEREVQPHLIRHEGFLKPSEMRNKKHRRELKRRRKAAEKALERENQENRHGKGTGTSRSLSVRPAYRISRTDQRILEWRKSANIC